MNYMEQVAQMMGVVLEEEFNIKGDNSSYKITKTGLYYFNEDKLCWLKVFGLLERILKGDYEIIDKPILDDIEKEYLSNVIKPFRDRVEYIIKNSAYSPIEWITIKYKDGGATNLPLFEKGTMYQGMEVNKKYSLEDLGL